MRMPDQAFEISRRSIDVVALDWDGTVVDSVPYKILHNQALAAEFGQELTTEQVRAIWNQSRDFPELMHRLTGCDDMTSRMEAIRRDYTNPLYAKRELPFAQAALKKARHLGFRVALLTSASRQVLEADEDLLGIDTREYFDYVQTADDTEHKKPDGRFFARMLGDLGINSHRAIYVGDEIKDGQAARQAGIGFVGVQTGMATAQEFAADGFKSVETIASIEFRV